MNKSTARFDSGVAPKVRNPLSSKLNADLSARYSLLAYPLGMSRSLRSVRLHTKQRAQATMFGGEDPCGFALEPLATIYESVV